jgi:hypothetical protein
MEVAVYQCMRLLKWLLWASFLGFTAYVMHDRAPHVTGFGHPTLATELMLFGLSGAALIAGLLQLMLRDKAYRKISTPSREADRTLVC